MARDGTFVVVDGSSSSSRERVLDSNELIRGIVSFLPHTYRFTATVNKKFCQAYQQEFGSDGSGTMTTFANAVASVHTARIWMAEYRHYVASWRRHICKYAALYGRLHVLQHFYLLESFPMTTTGGGDVGEHLSSSSSSSSSSWSSSPSLCARAAQGGHLAILQWLHEHGCAWNARTCSEAADGGRLDVLIWARERDCPWYTCTCYGAAAGGHLDVMQYARANGCPWCPRTCSEAAAYGRLVVLQWARANGCPWCARTCYNAAKAGHLDVLMWARENGCPWNAVNCLQVAASAEIATWIRNNNV
jgi:hypothetical protein